VIQSGRKWRVFVIGSLAAVAFLFVAIEFGRRLTTDGVTGNLHVWTQFAAGVLDGGAPYVDVWDNKPPLWEILNLAVYATGAYFPVFYVLIGVANTAAAWQLYRFGARLSTKRVGYIAAVLFLVAAGNLAGATVNPRHFAALLIVSAFLADSMTDAGVLVAAAGLLTQFSVFVIPVLILYHRLIDLDTRQVDWRPLARFVGGGIATVAVSYAIVWAIWGREAFVAAVSNSLLSVGGYISEYTERGPALWGDPVTNILQHISRVDEYAYLPLFAFVFLYAFYRNGGRFEMSGRNVGLLLLAIVLLSFPMAIRPSGFYHLPMLPFLAVLAACGIQALISGRLLSF
jgi:hypothetical protein